MTEKPYQMDMDKLHETVNEGKNSIIKSGDTYPRILSALSCRLSNQGSTEARETLLERLNLFTRYREGEDDFPNNDEEKIFLISVGLWEQCIQRKHKETHPVRGLDIMNCYIQSTDPEMADRYLEIFRKEFAEKMYNRLRIKGDDIEEIVSNYGEKTVRDSIINSVLLILVWHKAFGSTISEGQVSSEENYVVK